MIALRVNSIMLDYEMSFADQEDVFAVAEEVLYNTFCKFTIRKSLETLQTHNLL